MIYCSRLLMLLLVTEITAQAQTSRADSAISYLNRGTEWLTKGEFDKAVTHAERALQSCRKALPPPSADEPPSAGQKQFRQDMENRAKFLESGGEKFTYIPCLNDSPLGMRAIEKIVRRELAGWI